MSVMFNVVFASRCRSTHHKLAMDALRHVRGDDSVLWRNLFLKYHGSYLEGAKAPDDVFKDFKNHVLHVGDGWWGGAIKAVQTWYDRTVHALKQRDWEEAVYSAGVLSHYYTDPCQPFHTGQSEAEGAVHRAAEWSICKCYHEFQNILEADLGGYPEMELPATADWLADHVKAGAAAAHVHYEACIDHYDLARGVKNPLLGMDQEMKDRVARMVGHATVGFARLLERMFDESYVQPPHVELTLDSLIAQLRQPVNWVVKQLKDVKDRHAVMEMWREFQASGKVIEELPEDDRTVRRLHAQEVRGIAMGELDAEPARAPGAAFGEGAPKRHRSSDPVTARARGQRPRYTRSGKNVMGSGSGGTRLGVDAPPAIASPTVRPTTPAPATPRSGQVAPVPAVVATETVVRGTPRPHAWNEPRVTPVQEREAHAPPQASKPLLVEARIAPLVSRGPVAFVESTAQGDAPPLAPRETSPSQDVFASPAFERTIQDRRLEEAAASARLEQARQERDRGERERVARERAERERMELDRIAQERAERERIELERIERANRERQERERLEPRGNTRPASRRRESKRSAWRTSASRRNDWSPNGGRERLSSRYQPTRGFTRRVEIDSTGRVSTGQVSTGPALTVKASTGPTTTGPRRCRCRARPCQRGLSTPTRHARKRIEVATVGPKHPANARPRPRDLRRAPESSISTSPAPSPTARRSATRRRNAFGPWGFARSRTC